MRALYASLHDVRRELEIKDADLSSSAEQAWLVQTALPHVSARIEQLTGKEYAPRQRVRHFNAYGDHIDDLKRALWIRGNPLLEVVRLTIGGVEIEPEYIQYLEDDSPYYFLSLKHSAPAYWDTFEDDWINNIALEAVWGYRRDYPERGWAASGQVVGNNPLTSAGTSLSVVSSVVFSPGQMLRIEDEWLLVSAVPSATTLTVERGVRGSTAVEHAQGQAIAIWEPEPQIRRAALRWAAFLYQRRGSFETRKRDGMTGAVIEDMPDDAPAEIMNILGAFFDWSFQSGE